MELAVSFSACCRISSCWRRTCAGGGGRAGWMGGHAASTQATPGADPLSQWPRAPDRPQPSLPATPWSAATEQRRSTHRVGLPLDQVLDGAAALHQRADDARQVRHLLRRLRQRRHAAVLPGVVGQARGGAWPRGGAQGRAAGCTGTSKAHAARAECTSRRNAPAGAAGVLPTLGRTTVVKQMLYSCTAQRSAAGGQRRPSGARWSRWLVPVCCEPTQTGQPASQPAPAHSQRQTPCLTSATPLANPRANERGRRAAPG